MTAPCAGGVQHRIALLGPAIRNGDTRLMCSSQTDEWGTPPALFDRLHAEFRFTLDACSSHENAKCARHYTREDDGLAQDWSGETVWCNPPYGREIAAWVLKAFETGLSGSTVVMLLPARTDVGWWHCYVMRATEVRFIRGRLRFGGATTGAPFPSAIVVFARVQLRREVRFTTWER